jgi:hypothetical protein
MSTPVPRTPAAAANGAAGAMALSFGFNAFDAAPVVPPVANDGAANNDPVQGEGRNLDIDFAGADADPNALIARALHAGAVTTQRIVTSLEKSSMHGIQMQKMQTAERKLQDQAKTIRVARGASCGDVIRLLKLIDEEAYNVGFLNCARLLQPYVDHQQLAASIAALLSQDACTLIKWAQLCCLCVSACRSNTNTGTLRSVLKRYSRPQYFPLESSDGPAEHLSLVSLAFANMRWFGALASQCGTDVALDGDDTRELLRLHIDAWPKDLAAALHHLTDTTYDLEAFLEFYNRLPAATRGACSDAWPARSRRRTVAADAAGRRRSRSRSRSRSRDRARDRNRDRDRDRDRARRRET